MQKNIDNKSKERNLQKKKKDQVEEEDIQLNVVENDSYNLKNNFEIESDNGSEDLNGIIKQNLQASNESYNQDIFDSEATFKSIGVNIFDLFFPKFKKIYKKISLLYICIYKYSK